MSNLPKIPNYHVDHLIAEGGTARVYWGIDLHSGFPVAIKELKLRHMNNPVVRRQFKEIETYLYLYLDHPNVPKLKDFIDIPELGTMYIIMEFIQGTSLEHMIYNQMGLIPEQRALPIFLEVLDTVEALHRFGYLHLDIKSNNVMIQPDGQVKLIDLGIASRLSDMSGNTGFGTPCYMPPEQSEKGVCGRYTDVFALGIMLFEMLTGHLPFTSNNANYREAKEEIRNKIKYGETPKMDQFYPFISEELQDIVEIALLKNPEERFQTCADFANHLRDYMRRNYK